MKKQEKNPFRNISCDEVKKNLHSYVSMELASRDIGLNARIKRHLTMFCSECGKEFLKILKDKKNISQ